MSSEKSIKDYAKEAKRRLKSSFWQEYKDKVSDEISIAEADGLSTTKVKDYFYEKVAVTIKANKEFEEFYLKVKELLLNFGEVSDAIGRLTDKEYYQTLSYEQKQRYTLDLSNKYIKAKERFYKERLFEKTI